MSEKKTALELLADLVKDQPTAAFYLAIKELAERVQLLEQAQAALEAKQPMDQHAVYAANQVELNRLANEAKLRNMQPRNEPPAVIELPDSVYNELFMACREGKVRPEYDYQYPLAERITIGSTTFIRAKKGGIQ